MIGVQSLCFLRPRRRDQYGVRASDDGATNISFLRIVRQFLTATGFFLR